MGGLKCNITQAPEPETLRWSHLEYGWANRVVRDIVIFMTTAAMLFAGIYLITKSNVLKEALSYTDNCPEVRGFVLKLMDFLLKMMDFALKMMDFALKMLDFAGSCGSGRAR